MLPYCINCRSTLFSPNASICLNCERDPRIFETEIGDLYPLWLYDKVPLPDVCLTCGVQPDQSESEMHQLSFSIDADAKPKRGIGYVIMAFLLAPKVYFLAKAIDDATDTTGDKIEASISQCDACRSFLPAHLEARDLANKRILMLACRTFVDLAQVDQILDLSYNLSITSEDIQNGFSRTIAYEISDSGGSSVEIAEATIELPAGWAETLADHGEPSVKLRGKGAFNRDRTMRGDLYVYLEEMP